jgi:cell division protein FtsI/penicillin-binding protein 2
MKNRKLKTSRFMMFFVFLALAFIVLGGRFFQIQVLKGKDYYRMFENQCWKNITVTAHRGAIYDCNGVPLTYTIETENLYVCTDSLELIKEIVDKAAPVLNVSKSVLYKKLVSLKGKRTCIAKKIDPVTSGRLKALEIPCIESEVEYDREYPYGQSLAALIGHLNHEFKASAGVELLCDEHLRGSDGMQAFMQDGKGKLYPTFAQHDIPPIEGNDVYLTIDIEFQQILREEIKRAVDKWSAKAGMGALMDASTGRLLAIYYHDPNLTAEDSKLPRERTITDLFEPGSTFKTIVFAALLEENLLNLNDTIYAGEGCFSFNGIPLRDDKELDIITEAEAFIVSSNIATGRLALRLGPKKLFRYARDFGFGLSTGVGFPEEVKGRFRKPEVWSDYYCAMLSIGHELSTSTLQMTRVFGCFANHGNLMKPLLIDKVVSPSGGTIKRFHPEVERKIFSESTIKVMQELCALVVDTGTAKVAKTNGITFSGKTGTAEKPAEGGGYDKSKYMASFGGFFPRENPRICGLIVIDEPKKVHYGGYTAAPAFAQAARRITDLQNLREAITDEDALSAPDGLFKEYHDLSDEKNNQDNSEQLVQFASSWSAENPAKYENGDSLAVFIPDLKGKSARSAVSIILELGLQCSLEGTGTVIQSVPGGGEFAKNGDCIRLICDIGKKEVRH